MGERRSVQGSYRTRPESGCTEGLDGRVAEPMEGAGPLSRGAKAAYSVRTGEHDARPLRERASGRARLLRSNRTAGSRHRPSTGYAVKVCAQPMGVAAAGA